MLGFFRSNAQESLSMRVLDCLRMIENDMNALYASYVHVCNFGESPDLAISNQIFTKIVDLKIFVTCIYVSCVKIRKT